MSLGKILFCIGIAGIAISLALLFIGIFSTNKIDNLGFLWLSLIGFIGIGVSFILTIAGAIGWYLEPFVDKIRARNHKTGGSQSDYNIKIDKP